MRNSHALTRVLNGILWIKFNRPELMNALYGTAEENALLTQNFIKDGSRTIQQLVQDVVASTGENVRIARFSRFELGA